MFTCVVALQATISDGTQADGESSASLLHNLAADINSRRLLALLTDENAHSVNLWMQHRCHIYLPHPLALSCGFLSASLVNPCVHRTTLIDYQQRNQQHCMTAC